jgi:hypothetical protein
LAVREDSVTITRAEDERDLVAELADARERVHRLAILQLLRGWTVEAKIHIAELEREARADAKRSHEALRRFRRMQANGPADRYEEVARPPVRRRTKEFRP